MVTTQTPSSLKLIDVTFVPLQLHTNRHQLFICRKVSSYLYKVASENVGSMCLQFAYQD